jgi:hypothetical protein
MSQIVIETGAIKKAILYFFAIVGVLAIVSIIVMGAVNLYNIPHAQQTIVPVSASPTASAPTVTSPAQQYPYVTEFTVLSTTVANGHYEAISTSGQIFNLPDFNSWNSLWPRNTYTATITGTEADGMLDVGTVNRLSSSVTVSALTGGIQTSLSPSVIEFTVLSTTVMNGNYEVLTTDGRILYFTDFDTWNNLYPRNTYTGTVVGEEANGAYDIGTVNLISTAFYYQRGVYLRDSSSLFYHSPDYNPPVYHPPVNNPPVYHPPVNNPPVKKPPVYHPPVNKPSTDSSVVDPPLAVSPLATLSAASAPAPTDTPTDSLTATPIDNSVVGL